MFQKARDHTEQSSLLPWINEVHFLQYALMNRPCMKARGDKAKTEMR